MIQALFLFVIIAVVARCMNIYEAYYEERAMIDEAVERLSRMSSIDQPSHEVPTWLRSAWLLKQQMKSHGRE
jgi:hypothetical protein